MLSSNGFPLRSERLSHFLADDGQAGSNPKARLADNSLGIRRMCSPTFMQITVLTVEIVYNIQTLEIPK
jgi:hypothetical protein